MRDRLTRTPTLVKGIQIVWIGPMDEPLDVLGHNIAPPKYVHLSRILMRKTWL
jgi:hypothetical protein